MVYVEKAGMTGKTVSVWAREDNCLVKFEAGFSEEEKNGLYLDLITMHGGKRCGDYVQVNGGAYSESNLRGKLLVKGIKVRN